MSNLQVQDLNGILVVDSRLIAEELGVLHKSLKEMIRKYADKLEALPVNGLDPVAASSDTKITTQTAPRNTDGSGGEVFFYLTEEQANFIMSLSGNTEQVVEGKFRLVQAFSRAKAALVKQENNAEMMMSMLRELKEEIQTVKKLPFFMEKNPGIETIINAELNGGYPSIEMNCKEFLQNKERMLGIPLQHMSRQLAKRASNFYRCSKNANPRKRSGKNSFAGSDLAFIEAAWKSIMDEDFVDFLE
jgi:phage regulator Rha-like protein